mmetsp:Transcript_2089/g.6022  ORF Transcript_2089/g.6022 Transcript_2089/m.6022 type:complete len:259 (-) Transcript_2089:1925-2701(-)
MGGDHHRADDGPTGGRRGEHRRGVHGRWVASWGYRLLGPERRHRLHCGRNCRPRGLIRGHKQPRQHRGRGTLHADGDEFGRQALLPFRCPARQALQRRDARRVRRDGVPGALCRRRGAAAGHVQWARSQLCRHRLLRRPHGDVVRAARWSGWSTGGDHYRRGQRPGHFHICARLGPPRVPPVLLLCGAGGEALHFLHRGRVRRDGAPGVDCGGADAALHHLCRTGRCRRRPGLLHGERGGLRHACCFRFLRCPGGAYG